MPDFSLKIQFRLELHLRSRWGAHSAVRPKRWMWGKGKGKEKGGRGDRGKERCRGREMGKEKG